MRLFVALRLDARIHATLDDSIAKLRGLDRQKQVRWVDPAAIHLTLKFLGEVPDPGVLELETRLDAAVRGRPAPRLALTGLGAFPNARRPRVLWMGLHEEPQGAALAPLQEAIEAAAESLGWEREKRAFQPHLTLGRVREDRGGGTRPLPGPLLQALERSPAGSDEPRPQNRLALMRSHLSQAGVRYEEKRVWELVESP